MIRINVKKLDNNLNKIIFKGHADFDCYGKDIVCAAVSSTVLCSVNAILSINSKSIKIEKSDNLFVINIIENDSIVIKLLENMLRCLKDLEEQYPKNLKIS